MLTPLDRIYLARRAAEERYHAIATNNPKAAEAHKRLAEAYDAKLRRTLSVLV